MSSRLDRLRLLHRHDGWAGLLRHLSRRALAAVYARRVELLIVKRLAAPSDASAAAIRIVAATQADKPTLGRFNRHHRSARKAIACAQYLDNGYRGFLALAGDELIGYWWWTSARDVATTHPYLARFALTLPPDEAFAFEYFIVPAHRDRGAGVKVLTLVYAELARLGYRSVWGSVDEGNAAARWAYRMLGNTTARRVVSRELCSALLIQDRRVFLRNARWSVPHSYEHRLVCSFASRRRRPETNEVAASLSTHGV